MISPFNITGNIFGSIFGPIQYRWQRQKLRHWAAILQHRDEHHPPPLEARRRSVYKINYRTYCRI